MMAWLMRLLLAVQLIVVLILALLLWRVAGIRPAVAVAVALSGIAMLRFVIVANNFRLSATLTPEGLPPLRLGQWLALLWREYCASMIASSWHMPFSESRPLLPEQIDDTPVLLLHGYGCNAGFWKPMRCALDRAGIVHAAITMEPVFGSIEDYLDDVDRAVRCLARHSPSGRVILVGHSMGGLVARAYLRRYGRDQVQGIITLGSPHHGTALAHLSLGRNCRQMERSPCRMHAGEWLQQLWNEEYAAVRETIISIYSRHDNIIVPPGSSVLEGCRNIAVDAIGHVELPSHKHVQQLVVQFIVGLRRVSPAGRCGTDDEQVDQQTPLKQVDSR